MTLHRVVLALAIAGLGCMGGLGFLALGDLNHAHLARSAPGKSGADAGFAEAVGRFYSNQYTFVDLADVDPLTEPSVIFLGMATVFAWVMCPLNLYLSRSSPRWAALAMVLQLVAAFYGQGIVVPSLKASYLDADTGRLEFGGDTSVVAYYLSTVHVIQGTLLMLATLCLVADLIGVVERETAQRIARERKQK
jgi:hypothetical protein